MRALLVLGLVLAACDRPPAAVRALDSATTAEAIRLVEDPDDEVFRFVESGTPATLETSQLDELRAILRGLPDWPDYKCEFWPGIRVTLVGARGPSTVEICFSCGEVRVSGPSGTAVRHLKPAFERAATWARTVFPHDPGLRDLKADD